MPEKYKNLLKALVETNSTSDNYEELEKVRKLLEPEFIELGLKEQVFPLDGKHKLMIFDFPSATPGLLLVGHLGTVFSKNSDRPTRELQCPNSVVTLQLAQM